MEMTSRSAPGRGTGGRPAPVLVAFGWTASLLGYIVGRVLITVLGAAPGWFNLLLVLVLPLLSALAGTLVLPASWVRGAGGLLRHALVGVPVPLVFTLLAVMRTPSAYITGTVVVLMIVVMVVGTLVGALLGRLLRRDPDRAFRSSY